MSRQAESNCHLMIGLYATITVAVKNTLLFKYSLVFYSVLSDKQVNCNNHYTISANLSCGKGWNRTTIVGFSVRCIDQLCYLPNCAFCYGERTNSSRIVYNVLIEILARLPLAVFQYTLLFRTESNFNRTKNKFQLRHPSKSLISSSKNRNHK